MIFIRLYLHIKHENAITEKKPQKNADMKSINSEQILASPTIPIFSLPLSLPLLDLVSKTNKSKNVNLFNIKVYLNIFFFLSAQSVGVVL